MPLEVICAGVATMDTIALLDHPPDADERVVAEPFLRCGGGPAATAAVTLARLGVPVGFCGVVGEDPDGERVRADLDAAGVDTSLLFSRADVRTTQSIILVSRASGARSIITTPSTPPGPGQIPTDRSRWLHVDQTGYLSARAALQSRPGPALLSIDGGNPIDNLDLQEVALYAPTVTALQAAFPAPDVAAGLHAAATSGAGQVVATAGAHGCYLLEGGEVIHVPATAIEPVSTMGAGDVFHGALLAGLVQGLGLTAAAHRAGAVAALSCRALDGRSGIPDAAETEEFLHSAQRREGR